MWKTQRQQFQEKFLKIKEQQRQLQKEEEKRRKQLVEKQGRDGEHSAEARQALCEEIQRRREWSLLKLSDQQENMTMNQRQLEMQRKKIIDKHIGLKQQLENMKLHQELMIEQHRRQDQERRRLTEEIVESSHGALRQRLLSQPLKLAKEDEADKNKDIK